MNFDQIRELLLKSAIQGKLVPNLGITSVEQKRDSKKDNKPFHLPNTWKWMKLGDLVEVIAGTSYKKSDIVSESEGVRIIRGGNLSSDFNVLLKSDDVFVSKVLLDREKEVRESDIVIVASTGSKDVIGRPAVYEGNEAIQIGAFLRIVRPKDESYAKYLRVIFRSNYYRDHIRRCAKGTNINNIRKEYITSLEIPVPPKNEQSYIVKKLEEDFFEIDRAEKAYRELQNLSEVLRGKILQKAIEGNLVPQLDSEEPVEQIGSVPEDVPFTIPEKWKWRSLDEIFKFVDYRGKTPTKTASGVRLITASNVKQGYIDHKRVEYISEDEYASRHSRGISQKGDILFTTEAPLGNVAIADLEVYSAGQRVITLQTDSDNKSLLMYFMLSPYFQKALKDKATGTTAKGIKAARLKKMFLPIPPVEEQQRIVLKVEELLKQLEKITS